MTLSAPNLAFKRFEDFRQGLNGKKSVVRVAVDGSLNNYFMDLLREEGLLQEFEEYKPY